MCAFFVLFAISLLYEDFCISRLLRVENVSEKTLKLV